MFFTQVEVNAESSIKESNLDHSTKRVDWSLLLGNPGQMHLFDHYDRHNTAKGRGDSVTTREVPDL